MLFTTVITYPPISTINGYDVSLILGDDNDTTVMKTEVTVNTKQ